MDTGRPDGWEPGLSQQILDELDRFDPRFIAASVVALRDGATRLLGDHAKDIDVLGPDGAKALGDQWDVLQNEAESAFQVASVLSPHDFRALIDASYDPAWRAALRAWAEQNEDLLPDAVASWPEAAYRAAHLDLAGYRAEFDSNGAVLLPRLAYHRLPCDPTLAYRSPDLARLAMMVWRAASADSPIAAPILRPLPDGPTVGAKPIPQARAPEVGAGPERSEAPSQLTRSGPQAEGARLEEGFLGVLEALWKLEGDEDKRLRRELRRQRAGTQYGADVVFRADALRSNSTCLVECKNYTGSVRVSDIADKVLQAEAAFEAEPVDHWILISPHTDPSNELDVLIHRWNEREKFPFTVQVWSPQSGVRQLMSISPHAYHSIYGVDPPGMTPDDIRQTVAEFAERLRPTPRLPRSITTHITDDKTLVQPSEVSWLNLFGAHIERRGTDESGARLERTLEEEILSVFQFPRRQVNVALLLAEFGEGKSFFTVSMCKRLRDRFIAEPSPTTPLPLRLFLRGYRHCSAPLDFLKSQLEVAGIDFQSWHQLVSKWSVLVVLDGMDEMSVRQDTGATRENLEKIGDLIEMLDGLPILITSRPHFFSSTPDRERFYDRLRRPHVFWMAKPERRETVAHLRSYAEGSYLSHKLNRVKELRDPIGLAGKVLFLEMIKETLADLPEDRFDESVLYDTYVKQALSRKVELLRDPESALQDSELFDHLERLLERVAIAIHVGGEGTVDLRTFLQEAGGAARLLWQAAKHDDAIDANTVEDDASVRVGTRSLLKRVSLHDASTGDDEEQWLVDFFHRSMKEYFVARALNRALYEDDAFTATRKLLLHAPIQPEIARFYGLLCSNNAAAEGTLSSLTHSALRGSGQGALGGGAISLLHARGSGLVRTEWKNLDLDGAFLPRANLRGTDLRGSTLRGADLSSADLAGADLRGCDLTGANLDVADSAIAITPDVVADRWVCLSSEGGLGSIVRGAHDELSYIPLSLTGSILWPKRVSMVGEDVALITGDAETSLVEVSLDGVTEFTVFRIANRIRGLDFPGPRRMGLLVGADSISPWTAILVDLDNAEALWQVDVDPDVACCRWGTDILVVGYEKRIEVHRLGERPKAFDLDRNLACLELLDNDRGIAVLAGDGSLLVTSLPGAEGFTEVHDGTGTALGVNGVHLVSAGSEGALALTRIEPDGALTVLTRLARRLQCIGAKVDGLEGERERMLLLANGAIEVETATGR